MFTPCFWSPKTAANSLFGGITAPCARRGIVTVFKLNPKCLPPIPITQSGTSKLRVFNTFTIAFTAVSATLIAILSIDLKESGNTLNIAVHHVIVNIGFILEFQYCFMFSQAPFIFSLIKSQFAAIGAANVTAPAASNPSPSGIVVGLNSSSTPKTTKNLPIVASVWPNGPCNVCFIVSHLGAIAFHNIIAVQAPF